MVLPHLDRHPDQYLRNTHLQIILDLSDGRVPKFWRPPTGDMDNRVRAIAREVFGLTRMNWFPIVFVVYSRCTSCALELRHR